MTAGRIDTAAGSSAAACPRPPVLTAPDLGRLRDGEADELAAGEMVEDLELVEADLSGGDLSAPGTGENNPRCPEPICDRTGP